MGAIMNGMTLSKLRSYGSGFLIFSDYGRPSIRLGALMHIPPLYVFTHDSIGVGEDGPTHQPIEQLMSLRAMPGLHRDPPVRRERGVEAYRIAMTEKHAAGDPRADAAGACRRSTATKYAPASGLAKGGYALNNEPKPDVLLIGTGSEVSAVRRGGREAHGARGSRPAW